GHKHISMCVCVGVKGSVANLPKCMEHVLCSSLGACVYKSVLMCAHIYVWGELGRCVSESVCLCVCVGMCVWLVCCVVCVCVVWCVCLWSDGVCVCVCVCVPLGVCVCV